MAKPTEGEPTSQ